MIRTGTQSTTRSLRQRRRGLGEDTESRGSLAWRQSHNTVHVDAVRDPPGSQPSSNISGAPGPIPHTVSQSAGRTSTTRSSRTASRVPSTSAGTSSSEQDSIYAADLYSNVWFVWIQGAIILASYGLATYYAVSYTHLTLPTKRIV